MLLKSEENEDVNTTIGSKTENGDIYDDECSFDFANCKVKKITNLLAYDPKKEHLTISPGLNLKGQCPNVNCKAYKSK
jgi:hypothetical protein